MEAQELLNQWSELNKQPRAFGDAYEYLTKQLAILEALLSAGCSQIPSGTWEGDSDVRFMIRDRKRVLQEMRDRLS
jgi:hypothetical protein